jgi:hypothetical protein
MSEKDNTSNKGNCLRENLANIITVDNIGKYVLGTKKNGQPRSLRDIIVKDIRGIKGKSKKKKKKEGSDISKYYPFIFTPKKKIKKKKKKHWSF